MPVSGPWGGGSKVLTAIIEECHTRGHSITNSFEKKVDLIFCMDPRPDSVSSYDILLELRKRDESPIIQRVGDLGTHGKPELYDLVRSTERFSNYFVFPSKWALERSGFVGKNCEVIQNAPLSNFVRQKKSAISRPLQLITHHWSNNPMKGFDFYSELDAHCKNSTQLSFTYIGRKPEGVSFSDCHDPMDISGLIDNIGSKDVYITASKHEAGANHVLEAMALGLPVLYHDDGGSIPEYCEGRGYSFSSLEDVIKILDDDKKLKDMSEFSLYQRDSSDMAKEYVDLFEKVYESKH